MRRVLASFLFLTSIHCGGPAPEQAVEQTSQGLNEAHLLHYSWVAASSSQVAVAAPTASGPAHPSGSLTPAPAASFRASTGYDPMVAVSPNFMIAAEDHSLTFRDSNGSILKTDPLLFSPSKNMTYSATNFFAGFLYPTNADGTVNQSNVNRVAGWPSGVCDTTVFPTTQDNPYCINEFYDTRVAYSDGHFFILSAARNQLWKGDSTTTDPWVRRYYAVAVSNDEDPRHGFQQYMVFDSNYRDWPTLAVHGDNVVVGAKGSPESGKPAITVFSVQDMLAGNLPANFSYWASDISGAPVPVTQYESNYGYTLLARQSGSTLTLFGFQGTAKQSTRPALVKATVSLASSASYYAVVERAGFLHMATSTQLSAFDANNQVAQDCVRGIRVPLTFVGNTQGGVSFELSNDPFAGFRDGCIFVPHDAITRAKPSVAVNAAGDEVFVYGMASIRTSFARDPDVHYAVWYHDEPSVRTSAVLDTGDFQPIERHQIGTNSDGTPQYEDTATPMVWENGISSDLSWAVTAPDGYTIWVAHSIPVLNKTCATPDVQCEPVSPGAHFPFRQVLGRLVP